jgi:hypothetical protein
MTNRLGKVAINSGAHFPSTKIIIEIGKSAYAKQRLILTVSDDVVGFNPSTLNLKLNTISERELSETVEFANVSGKTLQIYSVKLDAPLEGAINESAMKSFFTSLIGKEIDSTINTDIDIIRIRLNNDLSEETMLEPITIKGQLIVTLRAKDTSILFDEFIPTNIRITSGANVGASCLKVNNAVKSKTHKIPLPTSVLPPPEEDHELIYCFAKKTPNYDVSSHDEVDIQKNGRKTPKNAIYGSHNINTDDKINRVHKERLPTSVLPEQEAPSSWIKADVDAKTKHRTSKPIKLMEYILKYWSKEGDTILDPTMGSGTMGVACKNMNRNFIGIEKELEFYELARERIGE